MASVALFHGPERPFELIEREIPVPVEEEILVRIACCTLCRSDLHTQAGRRIEPTPTVLGHEIVGRIEAFGPRATPIDHRGLPLEIGTRVTWSIVASCGDCFYCRANFPQKCLTLFKYGHRKATLDRPFDGGLADYVLIQPGSAVMKLSESLPDEVASLANCAGGTAAAVLREAAPAGFGSLLILGAGVLGLLATAMARNLGYREVIVCEPSEHRRELAREFGATQVVSPEDCSHGTVDAALELAGTRSSVEAALGAPRVGGHVILAGTVHRTTGVQFDPETVVRRMLTIRGVHNYAPRDLAEAVAFLESAGDRFPFDRLIGPGFALSEVNSAFSFAQAHPGLRVAVKPTMSFERSLPEKGT